MNIRDAVIKLSLGNVLTRILQFSGIILFTQQLGAGAMGSFFLFQSLLGMVGVPADLGVSRAAEKRISEGSRLGTVTSTSIVVKGVLLIPWVVLLVLGSKYISEYVGVEGVLPLLLLGFTIREAKKLSVRILAGQLKIDNVAIFRLIAQLAWVGIGIALISAGWGVLAIITSIIVSDFIIMTGCLIRMKTVFSFPDLEHAQDLISFGKYVSIGSAGGLVYSWMDVTMLRLFGIPTELIGAYEIAWRVASVGMLVTGAVRESLFSKISDWYSRGEIEQLEDALYTWVQLPLYLTIPALAGAVVLGSSILGVGFGAAVTVAYPVLILFMAEKVVRSVKMTFNPTLYAVNKPDLAYRGTIANVVVNLLLNIVLIPVLGITGAAIATTAGAIISTILGLYYLGGIITIRLPFRRIVWSGIAATSMAMLVLQVKQISPPGLATVAIGIAIGATSYFAIMLCHPGIRNDLRQTYSML